MLLYPKTLSREKTFAKKNISLIFLNNLSRMSDFKSFTENSQIREIHESFSEESNQYKTVDT